MLIRAHDQVKTAICII